MTQTILLTGATGAVGSRLLPLLPDRGLIVRALTRHPERVPRPPGVDPVIGDLADPAAVRRAVAGIDAVFLACGNVPDQVMYESMVIDEAVRAGVGLVVKLSARGAERGHPVAFWDWHARIEEHLAASGVPAVVLRPGFAMTNLFAVAASVTAAGMLAAPAGGARIAMIDPADVAAVAAAALTEPGHAGRTYTLTGPTAIDYPTVADDLSAAIGAPVRFLDVPPAAAEAAMVDAGVPAFAAAQVVTVFAALRDGAQATTTTTVEEVTGRSPGSFAAFARAHAAVFGATAGVPA